MKPALEKVKGFFKGLGKTVRVLLVVAAVVIAGVVAAVLVFRATRPYVVLFSGLSSDDMSAALSYMDDNGYGNYRVQGSDTILVPESQEAAIRAGFLRDGYPSSGFSYDIYLDNVGIMSSESDRQQLILYDLQDRIGATIQCLTGVQEARVTITLGEDSRYLLNEDDVTEATAYVVVVMQRGQTLSTQMADSIRQLIAAGVKGLQVDNVTLVDGDGVAYSTSADGVGTASDASALKLALESEVNAQVRRDILNVLIPLYGEENLRVSVHSTVEVGHSYVESVEYSYPDETYWDSLGGHGLIGTIVYDNVVDRGDNDTTGGVPGTSTNSDLSEYVYNETNPDGTEDYIGVSGTVNHDNDVTTTQTEYTSGVVTDVSVAITINSTTAGLVDAESLVTHAASAAGIQREYQADKISILAQPFYVEPEEEPAPEEPDALFLGLFPWWMVYALIAGLALFLILLILILLLVHRSKKRKAKRRREAEEASLTAAAEAANAIHAAEEQQGAQIMDLHSERSMELRQEVRKFAEENPEIAAQMVKSWLKGGGEDHG